MSGVKRLPVSVSVGVYITDNEGKLLFLQQESGIQKSKWGPPAGGMNPHENPLITAEKKTKKEIGVDIQLLDLIGVYTTDRGDKKLGIGFAFRGKLPSEKIKIKKGEISKFQYFSYGEIISLIKQDKIYKPEYVTPVLKDWIKGESYPLDLIKPIIRMS